MTQVAAAGIVRRIYHNGGRLLSGKAAAGIVGLLYMVVAARVLGPGQYGVLVLVHAFATGVGGIVNFPGWHAVVRYGARWRAEERPDALLRLLRFTGVVEMVAAVTAVAVAATLGPVLGPRLGWPPEAVTFSIPYSLAVLASARSTPAGYLQSIGRFDLLGFHNLVPPLVRLAGAILVWATGAGLKGFLVAWLLAALLEWASLWAIGFVAARREVGRSRIVGPTVGAVRDNPGIGRFMLIANADVTLGELAGRVAPLVVGWTLGPAAVGLYAVAQRATVVIAQPASILGQAAYAELAGLVAAGRGGRPLRRAVLGCVAVAAAGAVPVVALLWMFSRPIAVTIGGGAFAGAADLMVWLSGARALLLVAPPAGAALIALGRPSRTALANLAANLLPLPLLPVLLVRYGLDAAGWFAVGQAVVAAGALTIFLLVESGRRDGRRIEVPA